MLTKYYRRELPWQSDRKPDIKEGTKQTALPRLQRGVNWQPDRQWHSSEGGRRLFFQKSQGVPTYRAFEGWR